MTGKTEFKCGGMWERGCGANLQICQLHVSNPRDTVHKSLFVSMESTKDSGAGKV